MNIPLQSVPAASRPLAPVHALPGNADLLDHASTPPAAWQALVLDEIDYGIVMLSVQHQVVYCNPAARRELNAEHPLELVGPTLRARRNEDAARLGAALRAATHQGLRRMLTFDTGKGMTPVAVVPTPDPDGTGASVLVMLGRSQVCEALSAHGFANCLGLTPAERAVLSQLSAHQRPVDIANTLCVALSTVRTHIANIRLKTGASSIRDLVELLARLPPLTSALRH